MATNEQTQKDTAKAKSRTFGRSKKTSKDTAKAKSRTFGRSKRAKEEEEEELRVQEELLRNNPMMQPTDLLGQQAPQGNVNPLALAGLGGAAAFQGMFPFAGEAAANSRGTTLPQLMGSGNSQFTGANAGRLTPGTQIVPQTQLVPSGQPPAVRPMGGPPAVPGAQVVPLGGNQGNPMKMAQKVGQPGLPSSGDTLKPGMGSLQKLASGVLKGGIIGGLATPNEMADTTLGGAYERRVAAGEDPNQVRQSLGLASDYGEIQLLSEPELAASQMSRLGDEPLVFNAPTGPSSTATQAAQIAATLPGDSGLMGAPGVQETGIPTATLNVDGGSATVPQGLADLTFQTLNPMKEAEAGSPQAIFERIRAKGALSPELIAAGQARAEAMGTTFDPEAGFSRDAYLAGQADPGPMGRDATMDRLGGRTLNEYLNAPDGTEGVSGLRTDPQGRMIPGGFDTRADAYGEYEAASAEREGRLSARMQQPGETRTERDTRIAGERTTGPRTYGGYTTSQLRDVVGGGKALRAAQMQAEMQGKQAEAEYLQEQQISDQAAAYKQQYDEMRLYKLGLEIEKMQREKPSEYQEAAAGVDEAIAAGSIKPEDRNKFILRELGWQAKEGEDSSGITSLIYGDGAESGGKSNIPQAAIDALISDPSKASDFDKYFGPGSSAKFL